VTSIFTHIYMKSKHEGMSDRMQIQGLYDERDIEISTSTISFDSDNSPRSIIDELDDIYTHRSHARCIHLTYLTLLSMTFGVIYWMSYWLIFNRCENLVSLQSNSFSCKLVFIFQILTFISISLSPLFFILMIISWITFSCRNPIDPIRNEFIGFRLEGNQWENQINSYYKNQKNFFHFCSYRKRKELINRDYGYIILSPHGIILDEFFLLNSRINNGILIDNGRILKLDFKGCYKTEIFIYLPGDIINQQAWKDFMQKINIHDTLPSRC
jgi:hypothetical protein